MLANGASRTLRPVAPSRPVAVGSCTRNPMLRPLALAILALVAASCTLPAQGQVTRGDEGQCAARRPVAQVVRNPARRHVGLRLRLRHVSRIESATPTPVAGGANAVANSLSAAFQFRPERLEVRSTAEGLEFAARETTRLGGNGSAQR
jgi:hypothetical protein